MPSELDALDRWLAQLFNGDATLVGLLGGANKIRKGRARRSAELPVFLYSFMGADEDVAGQRLTRCISRPRLLAKVVTLGPPTTASEQAVSRIDTLLCPGWTMPARLTPPDADGVRFRVSTRRSMGWDEETPGESEDIYYTERGGIYQLWAARYAP